MSQLSCFGALTESGLHKDHIIIEESNHNQLDEQSIFEYENQ